MTCHWILLVTFLCGVSQAYFNSARPSYFSPPRYESCKESIEDLKALVEITRCLKPEPCVCPVCTSTLSEEVIIKLVNALIYTVTHTCGLNGRGVCGVPANNGGTGGNNGGGNTGGGNTDGGSTTGGNNGGGNTGGGNTGGGNTGGGNTGSGGKPPLVDIGVLNDEGTLNAKIAGKKILNVDVGSKNNQTTDGLLDIDLLNKTTLANVNVLGANILKLDLGDSGTPGGSGTPTSTGTSTTPTTTTQPTTSTGTTTAQPASGTQTATPTQSNNGSGTNNSIPTAATGVVNNQSVLPGNTGDVGSLNNTVINQGAGAASTSIKNSTTTSS